MRSLDHCMISSWPVSPGEVRPAPAIVSLWVVAFYPGERKSLSFLSLWEGYGFITLWGRLCSCGDYSLRDCVGIMSLCSWGRLWFFVLGGDYDFFIPGDYDILVGMILFVLRGLWGDYDLLPFISQFVPRKLSMGEVDPSSSVCFFLQLSLGTVA